MLVRARNLGVIDAVIGLELAGAAIGSNLARELGCSFIPTIPGKDGKLAVSLYNFRHGPMRVLIVDAKLLDGDRMAEVVQSARQHEATVVECMFISEVTTFLGRGRVDAPVWVLSTEGRPSCGMGIFSPSSGVKEKWRQDLKERGYFKIPSQCVQTAVDIHHLQFTEATVTKLVEWGESPHEIMMRDEPWLLNQVISPVVSEVTGGLVPRHEWLAFYRHRDYSKGGFSDAHRDLPDAGPSSFVDGMPRYVTVWVSLSRATPQNSCLYFLPACDDPFYLDPSRKGVLDSEALLPCIVCEPAEPGDVFVFSHRVVHWGSRPQSSSEPPRVTLTWTMTDPTFLAPHVDVMYGVPGAAVRATLISATAIALNGREEMTEEQWKKHIATFGRMKHVFTDEFAEDVRAKITNYRLLQSLKGAGGREKPIPRSNRHVHFNEEYVDAISRVVDCTPPHSAGPVESADAPDACRLHE